MPGPLKPQGKLSFFAGLKLCANPKHQDRDFFQGRLEAGWGFCGYVEVAFEGQAGAGYGAFVEEAAD